MTNKSIIRGLLASAALLLVGCAGAAGPAGPAGPQGPQGPAGPAAEITCTQCHNEQPLIAGKRLQWETSLHGSGDAYLRGTSAGCAGCHSGGGFSLRVAAGLNPDEVEAGDPNPTRQDCRACHQIHTTYTDADFALTTSDAVTLYASGDVFDTGLGNLCANCHQPRAAFPAPVDGMVEVDSTRWGPHHGVEAAVLLGSGGALVEGSPSAHALVVRDGCVACHMGDGRNHTMEPQISACEACHADIESFDVNGVQSEVEELAAEVAELLEAEGLLQDGHPVEGVYDAAKAAALWNYILAVEEDTSLGVHNSTYILALLQQALASLTVDQQ